MDGWPEKAVSAQSRPVCKKRSWEPLVEEVIPYLGRGGVQADAV